MADMTRKITTGILGSGAAARIHAEALKLCPDRDFVGVYSIDTKGAAEFAQQYGIKVFASREEMFDACECIHICTPSGFHCQDSIDCLRHGKHVVCEKPLCMTKEECGLLLEETAKSGKCFMPISQHRYTETYDKIKTAVDGGKLGEIVNANVRVMYYRDPQYYSTSSWRGTRKQDGGVLMNQGIHHIDVLLGILGKPESVAATASNKRHKIESPDTVTALVKFPGDVTATMAVSTAAAPGYSARYTIIGTCGMVEVVEDTIVKWELEGEADETTKSMTTVETVETSDLMDNGLSGKTNPLDIDMSLHSHQFSEFTRVIREGAAQKYTLEDAVTTIRFLNSTFEAALEGRIAEV